MMMLALYIPGRQIAGSRLLMTELRFTGIYFAANSNRVYGDVAVAVAAKWKQSLSRVHVNEVTAHQSGKQVQAATGVSSGQAEKAAMLMRLTLVQIPVIKKRTKHGAPPHPDLCSNSVTFCYNIQVAASAMRRFFILRILISFVNSN